MDTTAKFLVDHLLSSGIDTYFGIPGGPISPMFDAVLRTIGSNLVESRHETAALFEAIGYYKTTGKVPVVLVSAGPGIANSLNGIASAKALGVPLLVISGEVAWERSDQILLQNGGPDGLDIERTFAPHTEKVLRLRNADSAIQELNNFLRTRSSNSPSIVVLPINVGNSVIKPIAIDDGKIVSTSSVDIIAVYEAASLLNSARKPLLVLGYGSKKYGPEILNLINSLQIPFATTPQGKGAGPDSHFLSLRNLGLGASKWTREYLSTAPDVVLVLGTDLDDCAIGTVGLADSSTKIIHVDLNNRVFNRKYKTELGIVADIKLFAQKLSAIYNHTHNEFKPLVLQNIKISSPFDMELFETDESIPIAPHRAISDLQKSTTDIRFVTDIGEHMLFCLHYLDIEKPNQFSIDLGLGSMGSGICQSIGMCVGDKHPTICITGDGCMQMHGMEILTAIKYNLPIIFAVFNDARYNMVYHGFSFLFGRKENLGQTDYIDFVKFANSLGIPGVLIKKPDEINRSLIDSLFKNNKPAILDIRIDKEIRIKGAGRNEALKHMGEFDG